MGNIGSQKIRNYSRLTNVTIIFLPFNTAAKMQCIDQTKIRLFKALYRREINNELLYILNLEIMKIMGFSNLSRKINLHNDEFLQNSSVVFNNEEFQKSYL